MRSSDRPNRKWTGKRVQILSLPVEGTFMHSISCVAGVSINKDSKNLV